MYANDTVFLYTYKSSATVQIKWTEFPRITEYLEGNQVTLNLNKTITISFGYN